MRDLITIIENQSSFYHVTDKDSAEAIIRDGFYGGWGDVGFGVYFYDNPTDAKRYAERGGWDLSLSQPVILQVNDPQIEKVTPDPSWDNSEYQNMWWMDLSDYDEDYLWRPYKIEPISVIIESVTKNSQEARAFLKNKWNERNNSVNNDLSGACKFAALFAQQLYGGEIKANEFHTWVEKNGDIIDLTDDSEEMKYMKRGEIPPNQLSYAQAWGLEFPEDGIYEEDEYFMDEPDFIESIRSCAPRVKKWVEEFKSLTFKA